MDKDLNELLTKEILKSIPQNIKPIDYLIDILEIGRESAYRRMRGDIAFSFREIAELSLKLDFSVDEIIGKNKDERVFLDLQTDLSSNPEDGFLVMNQEYFKYIDLITKASNAEVLVSVSRVNSLFTIGFDMLFKFFYYKWVFQNQSTVHCPFSDMVLPAEISSIQQKIKSHVDLVDNITFILDRNIFLNLAREIQYYYNRKLISDADVFLLKKEMIELLNRLEQILQKGTNESGSNYQFYLSLLDVETSSIYAKYNENMISQSWIYAINSMAITNQQVCKIQKKWIKSLKKYSVLITQSNEILQATFINKQREYIENVTNDLLYYG
jgi:hypothetical protein